MSNGASFTSPNAASTVDIQSFAGGFILGVGTGTFTSAGTLLRSMSASDAFMDVSVNITGPVIVSTGTLNFDGGGTASGAFTVASGATLGLGASPGGTFNLAPSSSVAGPGSVLFRAFGTVNLAGSYNITGGTSLGNPVTANLTGAVANTGPVLLPSGTLQYWRPGLDLR